MAIFLIDEDMPRSTAKELIRAGHQVSGFLHGRNHSTSRFFHKDRNAKGGATLRFSNAKAGMNKQSVFYNCQTWVQKS